MRRNVVEQDLLHNDNLPLSDAPSLPRYADRRR